MHRIILLLPLLACAPLQLYDGDRTAFDRMLDVMEPMEITTEDQHLPRPAPLLSSPKTAPTPSPSPSPAVRPRSPVASGTTPSPSQRPTAAPGTGPSLNLEAPSPPKPARLNLKQKPPRKGPTVAEKKNFDDTVRAKPIPKLPKTPTPPLPKAPAPPSLPPPPSPKIPSAPTPPATPKTPRPPMPEAIAPKRERPKRQLITRAAPDQGATHRETSPWASADGLTSGTPATDSGEDVGLDDLFPPAPRPKGPRDPDGNRLLIGKRKGPLSDCYVDERLRDEAASGTIKVLIEVPETLPNKVSVMRSEFSKAMGACVSRSLSDIAFPGDPGGKSYRFAIPFTFRR